MVFLLALVGMLCWGIAPIFAKIGLNNINPFLGLTLRTLFTAVMVSGWMLISGSAYQIKTIPVNAWVLMGIEAVLATLIGDLAYFAAIKKGNVSLVTIIMSSSPLVTVLCSAIFLGEQITLTRVIGAGLVVIGIALAI